MHLPTSLPRSALGGSGGAIAWLEPGNLFIQSCDTPPGLKPVLLQYDGSMAAGVLNVTSASPTTDYTVSVNLLDDSVGNFTVTYLPDAQLSHVLPQRFAPEPSAQPLNWTLPATALAGLTSDANGVG